MSTANYKGEKYLNSSFHPVEDILTVEQSLKITINGTAFTITMRTPGHEEELVRGLLYSENVYTSLDIDPIILVTEKDEVGYITAMDVIIPPEKLGEGFLNSRSIMSTSSCGMCGKSELDTIMTKETGINHDEMIDPGNVIKMFGKMNSGQDTFRQSGGSHASAAFTTEGEMLTIREDIGRHNAVDKVIGSLILGKKLDKARCMTVSGRISYEIVNKCYAAGIPFLAAVSAPSSMAVDMAEKMGITLMAFCRESKLTVYSHAENLLHNHSVIVKSN